MFNFTGNVTDDKTQKSKFVLLCSEKTFWRDDKCIRYCKKTGNGILARRLHLDTRTIFPIYFTHIGAVKHNLHNSVGSSGKRVFLVKYSENCWITHKKEFFHSGHGLNLIFKRDEIVIGDHKKYLVLSSIENLQVPIDFTKIEELKNVLR